jgi:hypothetical protein
MMEAVRIGHKTGTAYMPGTSKYVYPADIEITFVKGERIAALRTFDVPIELYEAFKEDPEFMRYGFHRTSYPDLATRHGWRITQPDQ